MPLIFNPYALMNSVVEESLARAPDSLTSLEQIIKSAKLKLWHQWPVGVEFVANLVDGVEIRILQGLSERYEQLFMKTEDTKYNGLLQVAYERLNRLVDDPIVHSNLALVYQRQGKPEEAMKEAQTSVRLKPDDPRAHIMLAEIYAEQHKKSDASRALNAAAGLDRNKQHQGKIQAVRKEYHL